MAAIDYDELVAIDRSLGALLQSQRQQRITDEEAAGLINSKKSKYATSVAMINFPGTDRSSNSHCHQRLSQGGCPCLQMLLCLLL